MSICRYCMVKDRGRSRRSADSSVFTWFRGAANGLLAPSPAYFGACSKVVLCDRATVNHSFRVDTPGSQDEATDSETGMERCR